jgi:hypothetical protein
MFEQELAKTAQDKETTASLEQPVQDFLQVWRAMKVELKDAIRLGRLELRCDAAWRTLTQSQKDAAWMICFPEQRKIKEIFYAHAVGLR